MTHVNQAEMFPVAVFDADSRAAIAFTRSLGGRGVPVQVFSPRGVSAAGVSGYAAATATCPPLERPREFLPWLEDQVHAGTLRAVAPTSEVVAFYASLAADLFPLPVQQAMPRPVNALGMLFKDRLQASLDSLGVPTPRTRAPRSLEEVEELSCGLRFPLRVRSRFATGTATSRGQLVHTSEELLHACTTMLEDPLTRSMVARFPELRWPLLQEDVPSAQDAVFSLSGVLGPHGEVLSSSGIQKPAGSPLPGQRTVLQPWDDPEALYCGLGLAQVLLGTGVFELEFAWDAERREYLVLDAAPRARRDVHLDVARGQDLPWAWYQSLQTRAPAKAPSLQASWPEGVRFSPYPSTRAGQGALQAAGRPF